MAAGKITREELREKRAQRIASRPRRINISSASSSPATTTNQEAPTKRHEYPNQEQALAETTTQTVAEASHSQTSLESSSHLQTLSQAQNNPSQETVPPQEQSSKISYSQRKKEEARNKRREKFEQKRKELLQSAISKLKTHQESSGQKNEDALASLEKSISDQTHGQDFDGLSGSVTSSLSDQDVLDAASKNIPSEAPNAKDRFKRVLQGKGLILNDVVENNPDLKAHHKYVTSDAFKRKLELRKRNLQKVAEYLKKTGLIFQDNNFDILCNKISDNMLITIESISNRYRIACSKLSERADWPIRAGDKERIGKKQRYNAQEVVGEIFSEFQISQDKEHIIVDKSKQGSSVKMPNENFDSVSEEILKELLYSDNKGSLTMPSIKTTLKELELSASYSVPERKELSHDNFQHPVTAEATPATKPIIQTQTLPDTKKIETPSQTVNQFASQNQSLGQTEILSSNSQSPQVTSKPSPSVITTQKPKIMTTALKSVLQSSLKNANFNFKKANIDNLRAKLKALATKEPPQQK